MRSPLVLTTCLFAGLLTAACDPNPSLRITKRQETSDSGGPVRAVETLSCPEHQGALTRVSTASDGLSCTYAGPRGAEVTLQLVALADGQDAEAALLPFEAALRDLMPHTIERAGAGAEPGSAAEGGLVNVRSEGDSTSVRLPGLTVDADGDRSSVRIGPIHIDADDSDGTSSVSAGDEVVSVTANNDAAEIRARSSREALRATYALVDEQPSEAGWRRVGYEARGPVDGPLVVAVVHSKNHSEDETFDAAEELVSLNVGG